MRTGSGGEDPGRLQEEGRTMFENLRRAFREAVDNFREELGRDDVPEAVDRLLKGMVDEVTRAKADLRKLDEDLARAVRAADGEKGALETCRRRLALAEKIGDTETARIAREYCARHEERYQVLVQKAEALQNEIRLGREEVEGMLAKLQEARNSRDTLAATAGRSGARESIRGVDDLFSELDRMAEKIGETGARAEAARDFDFDSAGESTRLRDEIDFDAALGQRRREEELEARLEELKRRMGREP